MQAEHHLLAPGAVVSLQFAVSQFQSQLSATAFGGGEDDDHHAEWARLRAAQVTPITEMTDCLQGYYVALTLSYTFLVPEPHSRSLEFCRVH